MEIEEKHKIVDAHFRVMHQSLLATFRKKFPTLYREAEDLLQEAYAGLLAGSFDFDAALLEEDPAESVTRFVWTCYANKAKSRYRSNRVAQKARAMSTFVPQGKLVTDLGTGSLSLPVPDAQLDADLGSVQHRPELERVFAALSDDERLALMLRSDGHTRASASRITGWPAGTVSTRTDRAARKGRRVLQGYD